MTTQPAASWPEPAGSSSTGTAGERHVDGNPTGVWFDVANTAAYLAALDLITGARRVSAGDQARNPDPDTGYRPTLQDIATATRPVVS